MGTGADIVADPADEFVADFVGLGKSLDLQLKPIAGGYLVVDGAGRPAGRVTGALP